MAPIDLAPISFEVMNAVTGADESPYDKAPEPSRGFVASTFRGADRNSAIAHHIGILRSGVLSAGIYRFTHPGLSNAEPNRFSFHYYKWYAGLALFRDQGVARLEGITA